MSDVMFFRDVAYEHVAAYEALGWIDLGPRAGAHGAYGVRMKWTADENPPEPTHESGVPNSGATLTPSTPRAPP